MNGNFRDFVVSTKSPAWNGPLFAEAGRWREAYLYQQLKSMSRLVAGENWNAPEHT